MKHEQFEQCIYNTKILLAYMTTIDTKEIVHINEPLRKLYGFEDDSYIGKKCEEVLQGFYTTNKIEDVPILMLNKSYEWYKYNEFLDIHFALKDTLMEDNGIFYRMTIAYDISHEVDEISELQEDVLIDKSIIKCAKTLLSSDDIEESLEKLLETVCDFHGAERSHIFEINYKEEFISNTYEYTSDDAESLIDDLEHIDFDELPIFLELFNSEKSLNIPYLPSVFSEDTNEFEFFDEQGIQSLLLTRLYSEGKIIGFLGVNNPTKHYDDDTLMSTVAAFVVNGLDNLRSNNQLTSIVKKLEKLLSLEETVLSCAKTLFEDVNFDISINKLLETVGQYFRADRSYVFELKDKEEKYLSNTYEYCNGNIKSGMAESQHVSVEVLQRWFNIVEEGRKRIHVKSRETEVDKTTAEYQMLVNQNVFSFIIVPLYNTTGELLGFLGVDNPLRNTLDAKLLDTIGAFIVNNIEKRDMIKELEHLSYTDKLTGLQNRNCYLNSIENIKAEPPAALGVVFGDVNGLKVANDKLGHEYGDILIKWCAKFLKSNLKRLVYRIGGDEFICFIEDMECDEFYKLLYGMRNELYGMGVVNMSMAGIWQDKDIDVDKQIIETDKIMYLEKKKYYILKKLAGKTQTQELKELIDIIEKLSDDLN